MPSLAPQGRTIASLRRAIGYTQVELAQRVGVSERTVRNAERGTSIRPDFLKFIASGLGVSVAEIVDPCDECNVQARWQRNAERLLAGVGRLIAERDPAVLLAMADPSVVLRREGSIPGLALGQQLFGEFQGVSGLSRFLAESQQFWQACGNVDYYVEPPAGGGNVVVLRCGHEVPLRGGGRGWARSVVLCEFEQERIVRVDDFFVPCSGPPETGVLANYSKLAERRATGGMLSR